MIWSGLELGGLWEMKYCIRLTGKVWIYMRSHDSFFIREQHVVSCHVKSLTGYSHRKGAAHFMAHLYQATAKAPA